MIPTPVPVPYPYPPPEFPPVLPPLPTVVSLSVFQGMAASDGMVWLWLFAGLALCALAIRLWRDRR